MENFKNMVVIRKEKEKMKGIYLCACLARHTNYNLDYNDIDNYYNCNIIGDCLKIDLKKYDFIIASPCCNYWSRANYRRKKSLYSLNTRHLLIDLLIKLSELNKPFIIENVRNKPLMEKQGIFKIANFFNINVYFIGRHTYFTNIDINLECKQKTDNIQNLQHYSNKTDKYRQGGENVHNVIEIWLNYIVNNKYTNKNIKYKQMRLF